jgi:hypothetical protein
LLKIRYERLGAAWQIPCCPGSFPQASASVS